MTKSKNSLCRNCRFRSESEAVTFINRNLSEVFGKPVASRMISDVYDPGTPIDFWSLEAVAEVYVRAKETWFLTPVQKAELCNFLWNNRSTPLNDDAIFELMALRTRPDVVKIALEWFSDSLDPRLAVA